MDFPIVAVTGANRGIGLEICRQLANRGASVVLTARDTAAGNSAAANLANGNRLVRFHPLDVTDDQSATSLRDFLFRELGGCDVLINNAGMIADGDDSILSVAPSDVLATLATNSVAPLRLVQTLAPLLRKSRHGGRIVNISSGAGELTGFDGNWAPAYSLSKAALNFVTRMLAQVFAKDKVAVNSMCPGWVRTGMGGSEAPRDVTEGADTAVWLALDAPAELTGKFFRDRKVIPW
jgi:NAD(P)-dependent dehydrogenase (short-subunit alcohol dehydrogenase family)